MLVRPLAADGWAQAPRVLELGVATRKVATAAVIWAQPLSSMESGDDHEVCGFTACTFGKACRCRDAEAATSLLGSRLPSSPPVLAGKLLCNSPHLVCTLRWPKATSRHRATPGSHFAFTSLRVGCDSGNHNRHVREAYSLSLNPYTDYMFEWDLSVAAELPLAMAASIAVTLDPWVGLPHARACACAGGPRFPSSAGTRQRVSPTSATNKYNVILPEWFFFATNAGVLQCSSACTSRFPQWGGASPIQLRQRETRGHACRTTRALHAD